MFYDNYVKLCNSISKSPSAVAEEMGFMRSVVTRWSKGTVPRRATLQKVSDYFDVPISELIESQKEEPSAQMSEEQEKIMNETKDMSQAELALLMERIQQIKNSRI